MSEKRKKSINYEKVRFQFCSEGVERESGIIFLQNIIKHAEQKRWWHLTNMGSTAAKCNQKKMAARMTPTQLGFGIKQRIQTTMPAARRFLQDKQPGQALLKLKLNFVNAFSKVKKTSQHVTIQHHIFVSVISSSVLMKERNKEIL